MMRKKLISIALLVAVLTAFGFAPVASVQAAPAPAVGGLSTPVTGTFTDLLGGTGTFAGTFTLQRFTTVNGAIAAVGTLTGTLTDSAGVAQNVNQTVTMPVTNMSATCQVLHLELGPLDLNLLGLVVHLDQVVLDITAQRGGGLLGDLLCSIAGLLNGGVPLNTIVNLLNNILRLVG